MVKSITHTAGIDTGKDRLDVAIHGVGDPFTVDNTPAGWQRLADRLRHDGVQRVGIEASGSYERGVARHLQAAGFTVVVLQPLQVRAFARLHLRRAKSDRIDAVLIAACTHVLDPKETKAADPRLDGLCDQLTFIEQVEADSARLKTRLEHIRDERLRTMVTEDIERLRARRADELRRLVAAVREHADLAGRFDLVLSVPGIGERTAVALVLRMPELGAVSREEAAALAGLAPFVRESGRWEGERHIDGGRSRLRRSLYAAALPAASPNAANRTRWHWSPAPANSSSSPTPSSPAEPRGPNERSRLNGCYEGIYEVIRATRADPLSWTLLVGPLGPVC
jgi:transposase